ncbi:hypothetical protein ACHAWF_003732 [Thalassiosira exigua]
MELKEDPSKVHPIEESNDESMSYPKAKRPRPRGHDAPEAPWKTAIAALSTCVRRQDCIDALSTGFRIFNHTNEQVHDEEIASEVDAVLCRLLAFLLLKKSFEDDGGPGGGGASSSTSDTQERVRSIRMSDEIACTCQIIEMVFRCSKGALEISFQKAGPDFLHLLANILTRELPKYNASDEQMQNAPARVTDMKSANVCLRSVTKTLCHFARVQSATLSMAQHPRLLSLMISLLRYPLGTVPFEAHHNVIWVLANMACCNDNMQCMASHDSLLDTVIQAANIMHNLDDSRPIHHHALRLQHSAFRCLLNLSWDQHNKTPMSERDDLVDAICKTVRMRVLPWSGNESRSSLVAMLLQTRTFALGTLRNIAHTPPPQQYRLCTTQDSMLLHLLCDTTRSDEDSAIRDKSFAVIFNLVSTDTAEVLISHTRLLDTLVEAASLPSQSQVSNTPESASTMSYRSLYALDQAVLSRGPEECRLRVRHAIDQVNMARRFQNLAVPPE